jgi:hypothetical protein
VAVSGDLAGFEIAAFIAVAESGLFHFDFLI